MTKNIITRIALLAGIAAVLPCGLLASAAGQNTVTETPPAQTETAAASVITSGGISITDDAENSENFSTCTYTCCISDDAGYGDLTDAEIEELNGLYERLEELNGDGFKDENAAETEKILARMTELEKKAGWVFEYSEDDLKELLSEESYAEYEQINAEIDRLNTRLQELLEEAGIAGESMTEENSFTISTYSDES